MSDGCSFMKLRPRPKAFHRVPGHEAYVRYLYVERPGTACRHPWGTSHAVFEYERNTLWRPHGPFWQYWLLRPNLLADMLASEDYHIAEECAADAPHFVMIPNRERQRASRACWDRWYLQCAEKATTRQSGEEG